MPDTPSNVMSLIDRLADGIRLLYAASVDEELVLAGHLLGDHLTWDQISPDAQDRWRCVAVAADNELHAALDAMGAPDA